MQSWNSEHRLALITILYLMSVNRTIVLDKYSRTITLRLIDWFFRINCMKSEFKKSFDDSCVVLVSDTQTSEDSQILWLTFLDLKYDTEKVLDDSEAFDCKGRNSPHLNWRCFSFAQGHQCQQKPLIVGRNDSTVFDFIQKLTADFLSESFSSSDFITGVECYDASGCGFGLQWKRISRWDGRLVSFEVIGVDPDVRNVVEEDVFALVFDFVENTGWDLAACTYASDSLDVPFFGHVHLFEFSDCRDYDVNLPSTIWQVPSLDDFHAKLVIKLIVLLKQRNKMLLDCINSTVIWIVSDACKLDIERILSKHRNKYQVLQVIRDTSVLSAIKCHLDTFVAYNKTRIKFEHLPTFCDDDFAPVWDLFNHVEESWLLRFKAWWIFCVVDILKLQWLFSNNRAEDRVTEVCWGFNC